MLAKEYPMRCRVVQWPQETANLRIAVGVLFAYTHRKLDEQSAELRNVLPAHFWVDEERTDKAQRRLLVPTPGKFQEAPSRFGADPDGPPGGQTVAKDRTYPLGILPDLRQVPHQRDAIRRQTPAVPSGDDRGSLAHASCESLAASASSQNNLQLRLDFGLSKERLDVDRSKKGLGLAHRQAAPRSVDCRRCVHVLAQARTGRLLWPGALLPRAALVPPSSELLWHKGAARSDTMQTR